MDETEGAWFEDIAEAFSDAHELLHDCSTAYFEPRQFRRHLNAFVQAARNITFRVQSCRSEIPDFDAWYGPWQEYMRASELLRWIVDARNTVTKQRGLQAHSRATVRRISSYYPAGEISMDLDPDLPSEALIAGALASVPEEYRKYWTVEISRRWEIDELPGKEVLGGLVEALRLYDALIADLLRFLEEGTAPLPAAATFATPVRDCMPTPREVHSTVFDAATGSVYKEEYQKIAVDSELAQRAAEDIGRPTPEMVAQMSSQDLNEVVEGHLEMAKMVLQGQGEYVPMYFLRRDGRWTQHMTQFIDKQQKYLTMHHLGRLVEETGVDAVVLVAEAWTGGVASEELGPYIDVSETEDRGESIMASGADSAGSFRMIGESFERTEAGFDFERDVDTADSTLCPALWPVLRAWGFRPEESDGPGQPGNRSGDSQV